MNATESRLGVWSRKARLRRVLVCAPGLAHQRLTPETADELLFDDVIWLQQARRDHFDFVAKMVDTAGHDSHVRWRHRAEQPDPTEAEPDRCRGELATAASTSRHPHPDPSGIATSTPALTATVTNRARIASSRSAARRSQPRTVAAGTRSPRRSGDAPTRRRAPSTQPKSVPPHTLCAETPSPATTRASPHTLGNGLAAAGPDRPAPRSSGLGHNPTRPARHRNADTHSPRQPTGTRRGQDRPLPSPSVASAHPSVPRHTDGAHQQDQTRHDPDC